MRRGGSVGLCSPGCARATSSTLGVICCSAGSIDCSPTGRKVQSVRDQQYDDGAVWGWDKLREEHEHREGRDGTW